MWIRHRLIVLCIITALGLAASACGGGNGNTNVKGYGRDGYLGLTNSNPKIPNRAGTMLNYRTDTQLIEQALHEIPEIQKVRIALNGPNARVQIWLPSGMPESDMRRIETLARDRLAYNLPRYRIQLKTRVS